MCCLSLRLIPCLEVNIYPEGGREELPLKQVAKVKTTVRNINKRRTEFPSARDYVLHLCLALLLYFSPPEGVAERTELEEDDCP